MALRGHVFDKQLFSSDCYALVTDTFLNKNSGIIKGCDLTNTTSSIYIDNGYFVVKGRPIQEEGGTTIEVEPGTLDGIYCKLVCEIDMSQTNTTTSLNQVAYKILEDTTDYPVLMQEDITDGGTIYQFELAKFRRTLNGIEDFVDTRSFLNFDSIYDFVKNEIKKIEEGSLFITEEEFEAEMLNSGVVVSATEPTGDDRKKVWIQKGKNLINPETLINGSVSRTDGSYTYLNYSVVTDFISVQINTNYKIKLNDISLNQRIFRIAYYNENKEFVIATEDLNVTEYDIYPTSAKYIKVCFTIGDFNVLTVGDITSAKPQLEQNSVSTEYEEYIEPKIYVKNDNDVYEEFCTNLLPVNYFSDSVYDSTKLTLNQFTLQQMILKEGIVTIQMNFTIANSDGLGTEYVDWITVPTNIRPSKNFGVTVISPLQGVLGFGYYQATSGYLRLKMFSAIPQKSEIQILGSYCLD